MVRPRRSSRRSVLSKTEMSVEPKIELIAKKNMNDIVDHDADDEGASINSSSDTSASTASSSIELSSENNESSSEDSSSSSSDDDSDDDNSNTEKKSSSRLFVPFRTVGRICSDRPYYLNGNGGRHSGEATITVPMGHSFLVYRLDKLQPVLVSRAASDPIQFVVSDESMQITVAIHSKMKLSLYQRIHILDTLSVANSSHNNKNDKWTIRHVVNLGRQRSEKTGQNATLLALLASRPVSSNAPVDEDGIPVLGDSDSDDDDDDDSSVDSSPDKHNNCVGEIILVVAHRRKLELVKRIPLHIGEEEDKMFVPSLALHPPTYVNKLVVGHSYKPQLILMRVDKPKLLYIFKTMPGNSGGVSCLESTPSLDVIAAGTTKGFVHLLHLRQDVLLFTLHCGNLRISSISFCTAAMGNSSDSREAYVSVGSMDGTIRVWDLQKTELVWQSKKLHKGGVCKSQFLPGEPLLLSCGKMSNSLQMHVFEGRTARLLRHRSGHTSPPTVIKPTHTITTTDNNNSTDASRCQMITGGSSDGTIRVVSTVRSVLDTEYSQGVGLQKRAAKLGIDVADLKLPVLLDVAIGEKMLGKSSENVNAEVNGDMVSIHANHSMAYVWSTSRKAQSGPVLRQPHWNISTVQKQPPISTHATSVVLSACCNFVMVGTKGGTIYKYNIQSGLPRGSYPKVLEEDKKIKKSQGAGSVERTMKKLSKGFEVESIAVNANDNKALAEEAKLEAKKKRFLNTHSHSTPVMGLAIDALNRILTSVGKDGTVLFWYVVSHAPAQKKLLLPKSRQDIEVTKTCHIRSGNFLAIGMSDGLIFVLDGNNIVRKFHSFSSIVDMAWSPDGRKLYSVGDSGIVHVWDVPSYTCMDAMKFVSGKPTSIAILGGGEILATSHRGQLGICLWSDKSFFQTLHLQSTHDDKTLTVNSKHSLLKPILMHEGFEDENETRASIEISDDLGITPAISQKEEDEDDEFTNNGKKNLAQPKQDGLITLSGLPPGHWKNLFHLELVKQRNKPIEAPTKPKSAPFFLQWQGNDNVNNPNENENKDEKEVEVEEWDAVWEDEDKNNESEHEDDDSNGKVEVPNKRKQDMDLEGDEEGKSAEKKMKRNKVTYSRSHLSTLLRQCEDNDFHSVTSYLSTMGPSSIDVEFSSLCHGSHDDDGIGLLHLASKWLLQAFSSNTNFELMNAYLHRFLYLHGDILAGMELSAAKISSIKYNETDGVEDAQPDRMSEGTQRMALLTTIKQLKQTQNMTSMKLRNKMQNTLCLLRHFSRMV